MSIHIDLSSNFNLPSELTLSLEEGQILLSDQRMIMLHIGAMGSLRKELIDTLGIERARGLLTRLGYASGVRDAKLSAGAVPERAQPANSQIRSLIDRPEHLGRSPRRFDLGERGQFVEPSEG